MTSRSRNFIFTWNNYTNETIAFLGELECRYIIYGKERAPSTGTEHLQGYVVFSNARSVRSTRELFRGCHVDVARGDSAQNKAYCSKGGDFIERGDRPVTSREKGDNEVVRWGDALSAAKAGRVDDIPADIFIRYYTAIKKIGVDYMPAVSSLETTCGVWIWGQSGSGKTRAALAKWPEAFIKPRNVWWDGYRGEESVICDDVDKYDVKLGGYFKHWADFTPFIAEVKGCSIKIRPRVFVVTSQYTIEGIWEDAETRAALGRRFAVFHKKIGIDLIIE